MKSDLASFTGVSIHSAMTSAEVVVIDDEEAAANEMAHGLAKAGLTCAVLSNPWHALKLLADVRRPRVAVIDIRMPELNGLQLVDRLNVLGLTDRPEIILVSGNAGFDDAIQAMQLGVRRLLCKPLDLAQLVREVKTATIERDLRARRSAAAERDAGRKQLDVDDLIALSRVRERAFPKEMISDHCWRMYLELYKSDQKRQGISLTSLALVSGLPMATAIRKIHVMRDLGLVDFEVDANDRRRTLVYLTESGARQIEGFLKQFADEASDRTKLQDGGSVIIHSN